MTQNTLLWLESSQCQQAHYDAKNHDNANKLAPLSMKLKPIIIISIIALGTLPLLILVSINLRNHINRHEQSSRQALESRAAITHLALNQKTGYLQHELEKITSLPPIHDLTTLNDSTSRAKNLSSATEIINQWFVNSSEIKRFQFLKSSGETIATLLRQTDTDLSNFVVGEWSHIWDKLSLTDTISATIVFSTDNTHKPFIVMTYPILFADGSPLGFMRVGIDLAAFATDFGSYVVTAKEREAVSLNKEAHSPFKYKLPPLTGSTPVFQNKKTEQILWLPLAINNQQPIAWIGDSMDSSAAIQWKKSLIINILALLAITVILIVIIASSIARKVERVKVELVEGLDKIINNDQQVKFTWTFPQELNGLALDLTDLSKNYNLTRVANKAAQDKLQESEDKFRKLTASAQDGIIMMDNQGNIAYWNKAAERIFGFTEDQAMGQSSHKLLNLRRPDELQKAHPLSSSETLDLQEKLRPDVIELIAKRSDNNDIPIELSLASTEIKGQWHAIWIIRDISERKRAEAEAYIRQQQLIQADKMRSLGLLVSGVAHEINNPNSIAMLNTPLLAKAWQEITPILDSYHKNNGEFLVAGINYSEMREQIPQLFTSLSESTKRIKHIVKDLKDYARQEAPGSTELASINDIVNTAVRLTHNQIKKSAAQFKVKLGKKHLVRGNKQRLEQVVINLLQNACEAVSTTDNATIIIRTDQADDGKYVIITVEDSGIGIKDEDLNLLTDPFYTTKRTIGGTGLGLSVSVGIIKEHRGSLSFSSIPDCGTVATVSLPIANSTPAEV